MADETTIPAGQQPDVGAHEAQHTPSVPPATGLAAEALAPTASSNKKVEDKKEEGRPVSDAPEGGSGRAAQNAPSTTETSADAQKTSPKAAHVADAEDWEDEDDDLEDLDDVLDEFDPSKQPPKSKQTTSSSGGAGASTGKSTTAGAPPGLFPDDPNLDEEEFIKQLEAGMEAMMSGAGSSGGDSKGGSSKKGTSSGGNSGEMSDWDAITKQMSEDPNTAELMKLLMGEGAGKGGAGAGAKPSTSGAKQSRPGTSASSSNKPEGFQDTIRKTMERMQESGDRATQAAAEDAEGGDLIAQLMKAMEGGAGAGGEGGEGGFDQMLMGMMEQMTNKDILYDPMVELNQKFGPWLKENKGKIDEEEYKRFEVQAEIVKEIVDRFEQKDYSDDKPEDRSFIWEKMQTMQSTGGPPDDLVENPFGNDDSLQDAFKNGADDPGCPQQ